MAQRSDIEVTEELRQISQKALQSRAQRQAERKETEDAAVRSAAEAKGPRVVVANVRSA